MSTGIMIQKGFKPAGKGARGAQHPALMRAARRRKLRKRNKPSHVTGRIRRMWNSDEVQLNYHQVMRLMRERHYA